MAAQSPKPKEHKLNMFDKAQATIQPFLEMSGYQPKTTFWSDFSIADVFGESAIKDTYRRAFNDWKNNTEYITELTLILNWKIWYWKDKNEATARIYNDLWGETDQWCMDNLKGDDLSYFLRTTD